MQHRLPYLFSIVFVLLFSNILKGQVDTLFWFAVPYIDPTHADQPIYLRISTLDSASFVNVTFPANPSIQSYSFQMGANNISSIDLTYWKNMLEVTPNAIENKGMKISSTKKISAYYDVEGSQGGVVYNAEIFTLKGQYALGRKFYIPIQRTFSNPSNFNGYSSFDIVASENNTTVTISPTKNLVGHPAGVIFNIQLNKGQTYSARANSKAATEHPGGSLVTSDKPIAITVKDDDLQNSTCLDLIGDQIVPVDYIGKDYIVVKGYLTGNEEAVVFGTEANTLIYNKGSYYSTINAGGILPISITDNATYINASNPVYVMHISGFGCELGAPILPSIECTGFDQIGFTRPTSNSLFLNIMTKAGNQDAFILNGNASLVQASSFSAVPNKTDWVYAQLEFSEASIPVNTGSILKNSKGKFQLGMINGTASGSAVYGYFSGFNQYNPAINILDTCLNANTTFSLSDESMLSSVVWTFGDTNSGTANTSTLTKPLHVFTTPGNYAISSHVNYECGTKWLFETITVAPETILNLADSVKKCKDTITLDPAPLNCQNCKFSWSTNATTSTINVTKTGVYSVKTTSSAGCQKFDTTTVFSPFEGWNPKTNYEFCKNTSITLDAQLPVFKWSTGATTQFITVDTAGKFTPVVQKEGCLDSTLMTVIELPLPQITLQDSVSICSNKGLTISVTNPLLSTYKYLWSNGATTMSTLALMSGNYKVVVTDDKNCKTKDSIKVTINNIPFVSLGADKAICHNDSAKLFSLTGTSPFMWSTGQVADTIYVKKANQYIISVSTIHCSNADTIVITELPLPQITLQDSVTVCSNKGLIISVTNPLLSTYKYLWSNGATTMSSLVLMSGNYKVVVTDIKNCKTKDSIKVTIFKIPPVSLGADKTICPGDSAKLFALTGTSPFRWSTSQTADTIYVKTANQYIASVSDSHCSNADTIVVNLFPKPPVGFTSDMYFCKGTPMVLDAGVEKFYMWSTTETTQTITVPTTGNYYVYIQDMHDCLSHNTIDVHQWEVPEIANLDTIPDKCLFITASNGTPPYLYSINSVDFQSSPAFYSVFQGKYLVTIKDANGCTANQSLSVYDDIIIIPPFFSPNGDGKNDTWVIFGIESFPNSEIQIFDRFGKLLASFKGAEKSWDGTYLNKPLPPDDYWYIIDLKTKTKPFTGHVTLVK